LIKGDNHGRSNRSSRNGKNQKEPGKKEEKPVVFELASERYKQTNKSVLLFFFTILVI